MHGAAEKLVRVPLVLMENVVAAHNIHNLSSSLQDNSAGQQMLWNDKTFLLYTFNSMIDLSGPHVTRVFKYVL